MKMWSALPTVVSEFVLIIAVSYFPGQGRVLQKCLWAYSVGHSSLVLDALAWMITLFLDWKSMYTLSAFTSNVVQMYQFSQCFWMFCCFLLSNFVLVLLSYFYNSKCISNVLMHFPFQRETFDLVFEDCGGVWTWWDSLVTLLHPFFFFFNANWMVFQPFSAANEFSFFFDSIVVYIFSAVLP